VNSIPDEIIALDTNVYVFALRKTPGFSACEDLVFDKLEKLNVFVPLQIFIELQRNLTSNEMRGVLRALIRARSIRWDYTPAPAELIAQWEQRGAKKGDAVIAAHLQTASIAYLVSENRHFLAEISGLPFTVLNSAETLSKLEGRP
jgi:predicted nucleic-acid-binding protein